MLIFFIGFCLKHFLFITGENTNRNETIVREQYLGRQYQERRLPLSRDNYNGYDSIEPPMVANPGILVSILIVNLVNNNKRKMT